MTEIYNNIRELYKFSLPCNELASHIDFFSESSLENTRRLILTEHFSVKMFQSWTPTIWFNLGDPYYLELGNSRYLVNPGEDILLLRNTTVTRYVSSRDFIFTVKFFPGSLEAILGINQARLVNRIIFLKDILPRPLLCEIRKETSFQERVNLLQDYFLRRLNKDKKGNYYLHFVRETIANYQNKDFGLNTNQVAEKMFISSKTMNRYFNNVLGIGPKKYFSIVRARAAITRFVEDKQKFIPGEFGYYDMSHFYKEMSGFTQ